MTNPTTVPPAQPLIPRERSRRARESVTADNWQESPHNRWAFAHVAEMIPTVPIRRGNAAQGDHVQGQPPVIDLDSAIPTLAEFLIDSNTDAFVVVRDGQIVDERYFGDFSRTSRHLLMSVSKSVCGLTVGSLVGQGLIDIAERVSTYVPDLADSAYGDATVQQVLDMTVAVAYSEDYQDPASEVQAQDRVAGWRTPLVDDPADTYEFLAGLRKSGEHGSAMQYRSAGTDVLAWIIENVTGQSYADAVSTELWSHLDCDDDAIITIDRGGFGFANGGISCTARDLAKVGQLILNRGLVGNSQVVSEEWIREVLAGGDAQLCAGTIYQSVHPNGSYTKQWWVTGNDRGNLYASGIHGQFIWVDPPTNSIIVKFSSWPVAITEEHSRTHSAMFRLVSEALG